MSFSANFSLSEFQRASDRPATEREKEKAAQLSMLADIIRHALGDAPLVITSWIRSGDSSSAHFAGDGADGRPNRLLSQREIIDRVTSAMVSSGIWWGELIFYPFSDGHVHWTLYPVGGTRQILIADASETAFSAPTPALLATVPTTPGVPGGGGLSSGAAVLVVALALGTVALVAGASS